MTPGLRVGDPVDRRQPGRGEWWEVGGAASLELVAQCRRLDDQAFDVDRHARRTIRLQFRQPLAELGHGAAPVAAAPVVEADPNLQDPLVEVAHRIGLVDPDAFERFVLLEELLAVEFLDTVQQGGGRRVVATGASLGRAFPDANRHAGALPATAEARAELPSGEAAGSSR